MTTGYGVDEFIGDVKAILEREGPSEQGLNRIAERMSALVKNPAIADDAGVVLRNIHERRGQQDAGAAPSTGPLYEDDSGLVLVRARFGPEQMTPIHTHNSWGIVGIYRGRDRYQTWRRLDDGDGPGEARVELVEERIMEPGDVAIIPPPPQDIHAQQGYDGDVAYELVLFGSNRMRDDRLYFDPEAQTAQQVAMR
jgi:predicted metal-dependent enzyme (double-stranded beta helix superfamily)